MSLAEIDALPRMTDYLKPEDLDMEGCMRLAAEVLQDTAAEYVDARRAARQEPGNKYAQAHLRTLKDFYRSDHFKALSGGLATGDAVMKELDKRI